MPPPHFPESNQVLVEQAQQRKLVKPKALRIAMVRQLKSCILNDDVYFYEDRADVLWKVTSSGHVLQVNGWEERVIRGFNEFVDALDVVV